MSPPGPHWAVRAARLRGGPGARASGDRDARELGHVAPGEGTDMQ